GNFFNSWLNPCTRWSVVLTPGVVLIPATRPFFPIAAASASAAATPPAILSDEMVVAAMDGFWSVVSTRMTGIPALIARAIGACNATLSVGAIRIKSGCWAMAAFRYGNWVDGLKAAGEPLN